MSSTHLNENDPIHKVKVLIWSKLIIFDKRPTQLILTQR